MSRAECSVLPHATLLAYFVCQFIQHAHRVWTERHGLCASWVSGVNSTVVPAAAAAEAVKGGHRWSAHTEDTSFIAWSMRESLSHREEALDLIRGTVISDEERQGLGISSLCHWMSHLKPQALWVVEALVTLRSTRADPCVVLQLFGLVAWPFAVPTPSPISYDDGPSASIVLVLY